MFKIRVLKEMPKDKLYIIPDALRCPDCSVVLGSTLRVLLLNQEGKLIECPYCHYPIKPESIARQIGVIENIGE